MQIIEATPGANSPGEELLIHTLASELDDTYTLFQRVLLPRAREVIDAILVGPSGLLLLTTHEYAGTYACEGDEWFHSPDGGQSWQPGSENPIKQVLYDHIQLKSYLAREGLREVPLEKAVVLTHPRVNLIPQRPAARLFRLRELAAYARQLTGQTYLTPAQVDEVVAALQRTAPAAAPVQVTRPAGSQVPQRTRHNRTTWLTALALLLLCISAMCFAFALVLLLQNL